MANSNCLEGKLCPECGSEGPFDIECTCVATVSDDGTEDTRNFNWDGNAYCYCIECGWEGVVKDLDEADQELKKIDNSKVEDLALIDPKTNVGRRRLSERLKEE